jgi:two-component system, chemotaxis family, chemotaxis protein CheY
MNGALVMECSVLIVDDSPILRAAIRKVAAMAGVDPARIREAGNGAEALERLEEQPVDLVLLDINMPVMDGEQFVEALQERPHLRDTIIVVVSTESNRERLGRLEALGVRESLHKPFEPESLAEIIGRRLGVES